MVYEKKCVQCDKIIDFGGKDRGNLPDDAMEFNGDIYCRECVKKFVEFGTGEILDRISFIEQQIKEMQEELGLEKHLEGRKN